MNIYPPSSHFLQIPFLFIFSSLLHTCQDLAETNLRHLSFGICSTKYNYFYSVATKIESHISTPFMFQFYYSSVTRHFLYIPLPSSESLFTYNHTVNFAGNKCIGLVDIGWWGCWRI